MDSASFWAGWAFGELCGILTVFGLTWIALQVQAARATDLKTFKSYVAAVGPQQNALQRIALYVFILIWAIIESLNQIRRKGK